MRDKFNCVTFSPLLTFGAMSCVAHSMWRHIARKLCTLPTPDRAKHRRHKLYNGKIILDYHLNLFRVKILPTHNPKL